MSSVLYALLTFNILHRRNRLFYPVPGPALTVDPGTYGGGHVDELLPDIIHLFRLVCYYDTPALRHGRCLNELEPGEPVLVLHEDGA